MIEEYFRIAWRNLKERKSRSMLTIIGVFLGIFTIFVLLSLSLGLREYVDEQFELLGSDTFFIQAKGQAGGPGAGGAIELNLDDVDVVDKINGIEIVSYMAAGNTKITFKDKNRYYLTIGIPTDDKDKRDLVFVGFGPEDGRMLKRSDQKKVMVGYNYQYGNLYNKPIKVGNTIKLNDVEFEVIAIIEDVGNPADNQQVYISFEDFKDLFDSGDRIDYMIVKVKNGEDLNRVADEVEKKLMKARDVDEKTIDFTILTPESLMATFGIILNSITGFLVIIALISAVVGGIGIANTMYTSILERRKEIGTMKAVGAKNKDIWMIFVIEAGVLGLIGGIIGIIIGIGVAKLIEYIVVVIVGASLLRASLNPFLIVGCLLFGFIIGVMSGLLPSYQASKLKPVDALRHE